MPRADLAVRRPSLASGDRSGAPTRPGWAGPGSGRGLVPAPARYLRLWASTAEPWTSEPSAGPSQQKARTTISTAPTAATATCPQLAIALGRRRRHGPAAESAPTPHSPPSGGRARPRRGRAAARWFAAGRDRNDAAPAPSSTVPSTHPTGTSTNKPPGTPRPREPRPSRAPEPPAGIRPVGPPTAKGGCLVPCPVSVPRSSASSPRASC
jgi:hypothetical protein